MDGKVKVVITGWVKINGELYHIDSYEAEIANPDENTQWHCNVEQGKRLASH